MPQMPSLSNWVAPTLSVEELDKRIGELKAVHFWLEQNGKALGATIQALEVQKMTLATLKGMNFNMGDLANALKLKTATAWPGRRRSARPRPPRTRWPAPQARQGRRSARPSKAPVDSRRRRGRSAAVVGRAHPAVPGDRGRRHEGRRAEDGGRTARNWPPAWPRRRSRRRPAWRKAATGATRPRARRPPTQHARRKSARPT